MNARQLRLDMYVMGQLAPLILVTQMFCDLLPVLPQQLAMIRAADELHNTIIVIRLNVRK